MRGDGWTATDPYLKSGVTQTVDPSSFGNMGQKITQVVAEAANGQVDPNKISEVLNEAVTMAEKAGIDVTQVRATVQETVERAMRGDISSEEIAKGAKSIYDTISEMINPGRAKRAARTVAGESVQDFAERVAHNAANDIPTPEFRGVEDIVNATGYSDEANRVVHSLTEVFDEMGLRGDYRGIPLSDKELKESALEVVRALKGNDEAEAMKALFAEGGAIGDALPVFTLILKSDVEKITNELGQFLLKINTSAMTEDDLAKAFLEWGDNLLAEYMFKVDGFDGLQTGLGRALRTLRRDVQLNFDDIVTSAKQASKPLKEEIKNTLKQMNVRDKLDMVKRMQAGSMPVRLAPLMKVDGKTNQLWAFSNELWYNAVLSTPKTHGINFMSNGYKQLVVEPLENIIAGRLGWLANGGKWTSAHRAQYLQGTQAVSAFFDVLGDSFAMANKSFKLGRSLINPDQAATPYGRAFSAMGTGLDVSSGLGKMVDSVGNAVSLPTRLLLWGDELFKQAAYRSHVKISLYAKAEEIAKGLGIASKDLDNFITKYIADNIDQHYRDVFTEGGQFLKGAAGIGGTDAMKHAQAVTFTSDFEPGSFLRGLDNLKNKHPVFQRFVVPFLKTPANIALDGLEHIPIISLLSARNKAMWSAGGAQQAKVVAKWATGLATIGAVAGLSQRGSITGGGPKNKAHKDLLYASGWKPYSIKIGNTYIDYSKMEPIGSLLSIGADLADTLAAFNVDDPNEQNKVTKLIGAVVYSVANPLTSKTYFSGVSEALDVMYNGDASDLQRWVENQAMSYLAPGFLKAITRTIDPTIKEARGLLDRYQATLPGLSSLLPAKHSWVTGKPLEIHGGRLGVHVPVAWETNPESPVMKELLEYPTALTAPQNEIGGIKLDAAQTSDYYRLHGTVKIQGKNMVQALEKVINSRQYKAAGDGADNGSEARIAMLHREVLKYRMAARKELLVLHDELRDKLKQNSRGRQITQMIGQAESEKIRRARMEQRPSNSNNTPAQQLASTLSQFYRGNGNSQ
jgi:hypothetical protein